MAQDLPPHAPRPAAPGPPVAGLPAAVAAALLLPAPALAGPPEPGARPAPSAEAALSPPAARPAPDDAAADTLADPVPLARAFADDDGDFVADRVGDTVTVAGIATVGSGVLNAGRLTVYVDDGSDGVLLYAEEIRDPISAGDRVVARGEVAQYRGKDELVVHDYRVQPGAGTVPDPIPLAAPDSADLEAHEGRLVTLEGVVVGRGENEGGRYLWLYPEDGDGRIQVFVAGWRGWSVELAGFDYGDRVVATGLMGQFDYTDPPTGWYQLYPRSDADLRAAPAALGMGRTELAVAALGGLLLILGGSLVWGWRQHRGRSEALGRYRMLFEHNLAGVFHTTVDGEIVDFNPAWARLYGYDPGEEAEGRRAWDHYRDLSDREAYLRELREEGQVRDYEHRHLTRDGEEIRVVENARLITGDDGREHIVGTAVDLTGRREAEREQEAAEERYRLLFERNVAGAFRSSPDGTLLEVNRAFAEMLGWEDPAELEGRPVTGLYADPDARGELMEKLREEGRLGNEKLVLERKDGSRVWVLENSFLTEDPATGEQVNIGTVTEITEQVEAERAMEELAHRDPLTGLPNRRQLEQTAPRLLASADRQGRYVAVIYIDLDGFKEVNDRWGHAAGDQVLQRVAERLRSSVRDQDLPARIGGDEFLVVLPDQPSYEEARRAAARSAERYFREPLELEGRELSLSASVGVAIHPADADDFAQLVNDADRAMYRASRNGTLVEFYDQTVDRPYGGKLERRERLEQAMEEDRIVGYRQPIYGLAGERALTWVELLARWERSGGAVVDGVDLVPEMRSVGLLPRLDLRMLEQAAEQAADWKGGTVASNLSAETLATGGLVAEVEAILARHPAAEGRLAVEVTEHAALRDPTNSARVLEELTSLGVAVVLDDFGSGFSSLAHLEKLPVDSVKLDFSLVQQIGRSERAQALAAGAFELVHSLGARVVAEGVEREEQLRWLMRSDCDAVQGFLMGRPFPPGDPLPSTLARARAAAAPVHGGAAGDTAS